MINASRSELLTPTVTRGQPKVSHANLPSVLPAQYVLGFEVPVIDPKAMTPRDGVHELAEYLLDQLVVTEVGPVVENLSEEVARGCVIHDDVGVLSNGVDDRTMEGNDVRVGGDDRMQCRLTHVEMALASQCGSSCSSISCRSALWWLVWKALDCVRY